jgi:hypothetical protein
MTKTTSERNHEHLKIWIISFPCTCRRLFKFMSAENHFFLFLFRILILSSLRLLSPPWRLYHSPSSPPPTTTPLFPNSAQCRQILTHLIPVSNELNTCLGLRINSLFLEKLTWNRTWNKFVSPLNCVFCRSKFNNINVTYCTQLRRKSVEHSGEAMPYRSDRSPDTVKPASVTCSP